MTDRLNVQEPGSYYWRPMQSPHEAQSSRPLGIIRGEGVHVVDEHNRRLLDATSGGLSNVTLGYSADPIKEAIREQLEVLPYFTSFRGNTNEPVEALTHMLVHDWFEADGMNRVFLTSGGSDSVDTAMRLARQFWKICGKSDRYKFIALRNGYHGTNFGGGSLNSRPAIRRNYEPLLAGCFHVSTPCVFRNPFGETDPERLTDLCIRLLEEELVFQGPDTVAAFIAEPISAAGGLVVPPQRYWAEVRRLCDQYGVLLIADEVITGFGRSGKDSGARLWEVKPDIMCFAKGITSGYFPLGATMVNRQIASAFEDEKSTLGLIAHGYTYSGHPVGCAAAVATLKLSRELNVVENARRTGEILIAGLRSVARRHPEVADVRGRGLMACLEIVADRRSKRPADPGTMTAIGTATQDDGLMIRVNGSQILITPPLIVTEDHIQEIVEKLDRALIKVFR